MTAFFRVDWQDTTGISYMSITKHRGKRRTFVCGVFQKEKKRKKRKAKPGERRIRKKRQHHTGKKLG